MACSSGRDVHPANLQEVIPILSRTQEMHCAAVQERQKVQKAMEIPIPKLISPTASKSKSSTSRFAMPNSTCNRASTSSNLTSPLSRLNQPKTPVTARASESNFQVQVLCTLQKLE